MDFFEDRKRKRAIAKQVARLLAESRATYADLPEIFRFTLGQLMCQVQEDDPDTAMEAKAETRYVRCRQCGKVWHHDEAAFCSGCGTKLRQSEALDRSAATPNASVDIHCSGVEGIDVKNLVQAMHEELERIMQEQLLQEKAKRYGVIK